MSKEHDDWVKRHFGVDPSSYELTDPDPDLTQSADPNANDPSQSVEPTASQPTQSADPNANDPNQSVEPTASQPTQSADPNANDPNQSVEPTAVEPTQSVDPNANDPNQSVEPAASQPTQSADPNANDPNQSAEPAASQPTQSVDPNANDPNQSVEPAASQPTQSVDPNANDPNQSVEPAASQATQSVDPNANDPNQSVEPTTSQPTQSVDPNPQPVSDSVGDGISVPEDLVIEWDFDIGPKASLTLLDAQGKVKPSYTFRLGTASAMLEGKVKLFQHAAETALKEKISESVSLKEGAKSDGKKGSIFVEGTFDPGGPVQTKVTIEVAKFDKGKVTFCELRWDEVYTTAEGTFTFEGQIYKYTGKISTGIAFTPNWTKIGQWVLETLGVELEAAAVAGGTGTAGAVAIAVAPAAGVIGGIVGGLALCAGVCAAIGKMQELGRDAMEVCQAGSRQLYAYATSYGATMCGKPGNDARGNADAEAALQKIMADNPGSTHEQAVQSAIDSKHKWEDIAYRALLPVMRKQIEATYRQKEGTLGFFFSGNVLFQVMNDVLAEDSHY